MSEILPEIRPDDMKLLREYWEMRDRYDPIFGEFDPLTRQGPYPAAEMIKDMSDKLDEYYRQQRVEKRMPRVATA